MKRILLAITLLWTVCLWAQPASLYCDSTVFDVSFSYTLDSSNTVQFINNTNPINDYSYEWKFEWGVYDSTVNPSYTYSTADVYYPELTAIDSVGSRCMYIDTMSVNACMVYKTHNSNIQFYGSAVKYIHLDYGDGDTAKGFKRTNSPYLEYEPIDNHLYDSVGIYYVVVTVVDTFDNVCRDTTMIKIDCIADYDYTYDSTNTVYFTNQSQPIDSLSFLWDLEYLVTDTSRDPIYTYGSSGLISPRLTVTTPDNKICSIRDTISVNMCELDWRIHRDSLQLFIGTFSTSFDSVSWNFGDGFFSNISKEEVNYPGSVWKSTVSIPHVYQVDSIYQAIVRTIDEFGNSCIDSTNVVYEPCYAGFTKSLDTINNRVVLANYSSETPGSLYRYTFGDGSPAVNSSSKNISHSFSQYGTYEVCITVSNRARCADTFCDSVGLDSLGNLKSSGFTIEFVDSNFVTSVEDLVNSDAKLQDVVVYPNPSKNIFNIDLSKIDAQSEVLEMELYSTYGGLILKRRLNSPMEKIDLSNYADGLYFLRLSLGDKVSVEKLIKN